MWIVCQIGAREHYAIPRALQRAGELGALVTDFWVQPGSVLSRLPGGRRLQERYHSGLADAAVWAPNPRMLGFELEARIRKHRGWDLIEARNALFQLTSLSYLKSRITDHSFHGASPTLFSYSYAALELFRFAKERGWKTVLGQIDPGPEEERIVAEEHRRYPQLKSSWNPAPPAYWNSWREEIELADRIIVNSEWSRKCLLKEGVANDKLEVVPLVYTPQPSEEKPDDSAEDVSGDRPFRLLFLGQVNIRKGVGRLLEAMGCLKDEPVELVMVGPTEIDPTAWRDLANVQWLGPVPRSEVERHYRRADAFILPTLSDGYALTQLEALSHGLPVMASRQCGEAVVDGENGWVLRSLEPEVLSKDILAVMNRSKISSRLGSGFGIRDLEERLGIQK